MRIAVAQLNPTIGDIAGNVARIVQAICAARTEGAHLVLFSELALCGYPPEDLLLLPHFVRAVEEALRAIIAETQGIAVIVGTVRSNPHAGQKPLLNSAAIIDDGKLLGFTDKTLLAEYDVFFERRYFAPAQSIQLWPLCGQRIAVTICEDIWHHRVSEYSDDPIAQLSALQPTLHLNLSASPYDRGKLMTRVEVARGVTQRLGVPLIYCNQVGGNDGLIFDGRSFVMNASGEMTHVGKGFAEDLFMCNVIDLFQSRELALKPKSDCSGHLGIPVSPSHNLLAALVLGVRDYFHKQGFQKAILGLSGGIDSAVVACIAVEALGREHVHALTMPSRYTSQETLSDAQELATRLGITLTTLSIESPFESYLTLLKSDFSSCLGMTEENLQARIRGMLLMAFSNQSGALVLTASNKSELALGYATLYGDLCGGLGVLSDVKKTDVYVLAGQLSEIIPQSIIERPPSAELRPHQKDTDSLPPYDIVDALVEDYVELHLDADAIVAKRGYDSSLVKALITQIHRYEYKRRQAPLGLRVTRKAFATGRRFPIVQGL